MNYLSKTLSRIGLPDPASAIYLLLLQKGPKTATETARHANVFRPAVYKALVLLQEKGLVSLALQGKQKYYAAEKPDRIKNLIIEMASTVDAILPDLEGMMLKRNDKPAVRVFEGKKGVAAVFDDVIESCEKGETFYRYTSELDLDRVNSYLPKNYRERRDAKKLERQVISNRLSGTQKKSRLERFIKFLPQGFNQNVIQLIYADKVATIDLNTETSIILQNASIAHFQKIIFRNLYKSL